jgi:hypothetical protein
MTKKEMLEHVRKINQLTMAADHDASSDWYVWKVLGMIQGISEHIIEKEKRDEDDEGNPKDDRRSDS